MPHRLLYAVLGALFIAAPAARANLITFEGFDDLTTLSTQYTAVVFGNAVILKAQFSLDEGEFPPRSGVNIATAIVTPLTINFQYPTPFFEGYFTYGTKITVTAFDAAGATLDTATSAFDNNEAVSHDPGAAPNELIHIDAEGIRAINITGGPFAMDDISFNAPEPGTLLLILPLALALLWKLPSRRSAQ
jgi:hypothetical protein